MASSLDLAFDAAPAARPDAFAALRKAAAERILILDGAMGTQIQGLGFDEEPFPRRALRRLRLPSAGQQRPSDPDPARGDRGDPLRLCHGRRRHPRDQHLFLDRDRPGRLRHGGRGLRPEPRRRAAGARAPRSGPSRQDGKRRFVAGALGPTNRTASMSPDVNNPGYRAVTFDDLRDAYGEQIRGLIDGGADLILIETIFDTLNAKAAIFALRGDLRREGRPPAGDDLRHDHRPLRPHAVRPDADRLLAFGAPRQALHHRPQLRARRRGDARASGRDLPSVADTFVCAYPNAGLPNEFGEYDESPEAMAAQIARIRARGPRQHRRRLLRLDARPYPRHRRGGARLSRRAPSPSRRR